MKQKKALDCFRNKADLISKAASIEALFDVLFSDNDKVAVEYSTGLKNTRLAGKDAEKKIRDLTDKKNSGCDLDAIKKGIVKAFEMPLGRRPESIKALLLAPPETEMGLCCMLACAAIGATIVLPQDDRIQTVSDTARNHDVTHVIAYPLMLSALMKRTQKKALKSGKLESLNKALGSSGPVGKLIYGSTLKKTKTEMFGSSSEVIFTNNDGLNSNITSFFSKICYILGYYNSGIETPADPIEGKLDSMYIRSCVMVEAVRGKHVLVVSVDPGLSPRKTASVIRSVRSVRENGDAVFTTDDLSYGGHAINRSKVAEDYKNGTLNLIDPDSLPANAVMSEAEIKEKVTRCFAGVLDRSVDEISFTGDFFRTFNGESMDYFVLLGDLETAFDIVLSTKEGSRLSSVKDFTRYILKHMDD